MVGKRKKIVRIARSGKAVVTSPFRRANSAIGEPIPYDYPEHSLLGLPGELRNILYEYIFHPEDTEEYLRELQTNPHAVKHEHHSSQGASAGAGAESCNGGNGLTFLRTCRLVYHECRALGYTRLVANLSPFSLPNPYAFDVQKAISAQSLKIRPPVELIKRLTVQQFLFFGLYPWWMLRKSGIEPQELIIQICLCNKVEQLYSQPRKCKEVCDTIEQAAKDVRSLKRILVYYCGLEWPLWLCRERDVHFPSIVADCESQNGTKLEPVIEVEEPREEGEEEEDDHLSPVPSRSISSSQVTPPDAATPLEHEDIEPRPGRFRLVGDYYKAFVPDRDVIVDFVDSMELCGKECVRDRPPPPTPFNHSAASHPPSKGGRFVGPGPVVSDVVLTMPRSSSRHMLEFQILKPLYTRQAPDQRRRSTSRSTASTNSNTSRHTPRIFSAMTNSTIARAPAFTPA
jgi:hypothetical protein